MSGHPRLYRRGATYYHRAAIPVDIQDTYPKSAETFSLKTKDFQEALKQVRIAAVQVDQRFDAHREMLVQSSKPPLEELSDEQIKRIGSIFYVYRLGEDEDIRNGGFHEAENPTAVPHAVTFENYEDATGSFDKGIRKQQARGKIDEFYYWQAEDILTWSNVNICLSKESPSWEKLARELQAADIKSAEVTKARNVGDIVETPKIAGLEPEAEMPLLSKAVQEWADEKSRTSWVPKTEHENRTWMSHFITLVGDKPLSDYSKTDGRAFKSMLLKLPANWSKQEAIKGLSIEKAAIKAQDLGMKPMADSNVNKLLGFVDSFWTWAEDNYDDIRGSGSQPE